MLAVEFGLKLGVSSSEPSGNSDGDNSSSNEHLP